MWATRRQRIGRVGPGGCGVKEVTVWERHCYQNVMDGTGLHHLFTPTARSASIYTSSQASLLSVLCHRRGESGTGSSGQFQVSRALYMRPGALPFHVAPYPRKTWESHGRQLSNSRSCLY